MEYLVWAWLGALVLFIIIEIATTALTTIWFAGGALVAFLLNVFNAPLVAQIVAFIVVSLLLLIFLRPVLNKLLVKSKVKTNVDELIGSKVKVTEQINNIEGTGAVFANGLEWTARTEADDITIDKGEVVEIKSISGVKLIVTK